MAARKKSSRKRTPARGDDGGGLWAPRVGIVSLRLFTGGLWLHTAYMKLFGNADQSLFENVAHFRDGAYTRIVERGIETPPQVFGEPLTFFSDFLASVMLPARSFMAPAILVFELLLGVSLVFGIGVRLFGVLGAGLTLGFAMARSLPLFTVKAPNYLLVAVLLMLALTAAGRIAGFDKRLCHRWPRWIS